MFPIQDQFSGVAKANVEAQFALFTSLTSKTLESVEKVINLNLNAVKASMEESSLAAKELLAAKNPQEALSLLSSQGKPSYEKAMAYSNHLLNIATTAQTEIAKLTEQQIAHANRQFTEIAQQAADKAPVGAENMMTAFMKTAMNAFNTSIDQAGKAGKQTSETVENAIATVVNQTISPVAKTQAKTQAS